MRIETITRNGEQFALLPVDRLKRLVADSEALADAKAYDAAKARLESGADEVVPFEIVRRRLAGESPVKIWREYRGFTQEGLAEASSVSRPMIAAMESKRKTGGVGTLKKLAAALDVDLEHLA
jgi:predicted transcriptional regulator